MVHESENSKRVLLQATYTPIKSTEQKSGKPLMLKRPFDKLNLVTSIKPTHAEIAYAKNNHNIEDDNESSHKDFVNAIKTIESVIPELESPNVLHNVARLSEVNVDALVNIVGDVIKFRKAEVDSAIKSLDSIFDSYAQNLVRCGNQQSQDQDIPERSGMVRMETSLPNSNKNNILTTKYIGNAERNTLTSIALTPVEQKQKMKLNTLMDWATKNNVGNGKVMQILDLADKFSLPMDVMTVDSFSSDTGSIIIVALDLVDAFSTRMQMEPIGYLHLERLSFTPVGIERGELVYSVPLSPGEEVNITHKEWSNSSEEFQRIVTDYMENFSEEGVAEKTDLAQSSNSQQQHTDGYNLSVTASGGYGPVNITAEAGYNASNSSTSSAQLSRNHSLNITRKASSRVTKEHKTSFKVASASGTEDQAVRKIKNLFLDKATRVDYYQLLRKWRVDLTRYGLRLTYDITIPEPGLDILSKIEEINSINELLTKEFTFPPKDDKDHPTSFKLEDLNSGNYRTYAAEYNVPVVDDALPENKIYLPDSVNSSDAGSVAFIGEIKIDVDENYYIDTIDDYPSVYLPGSASPLEKTEAQKYLVYDKARIEDKGDQDMSGKLVLPYTYHDLDKFTLNLIVHLKLKESARKSWQLKTWNAIRDAYLSTYEANHQMLEKRLSDLKAELGTGDPLSLRKIEREEVMKGVIRWMFGPSFIFAPMYHVYENAKSFDKDIWKNVTLYGDVIKFLHHAIEWENMLYLLYPYFWSHSSRWEEKKYLQHPDIMHKVFLKSGSARVVLTIRPGFEHAFVSFIESGSLLPNQPTPYLSLAQEMQNDAKTNYPGIPTANPTSDPRPLLLPEQRKAWKDIEDIIKLLEKYHEINDNKYPTTTEMYPKTPTPTKKIFAVLEEFIEGKPNGVSGVSKVPRQDPWKRDYIYKSPGIHGEYDLASLGADGKVGGGAGLKPDGTPNENADITSWAEASLIGTWYEYTPTSALDITFNEKLPGGP
jgi:hypothetical protein